MEPVPLVVLMFRVVVPVITGSEPPKVKAVEVKVLVLIVPILVKTLEESIIWVPLI